MRRLLALELLTIAAVTVVAGLGYQYIFNGTSFMLPIVGSVVLSVGLSAALGLRRYTALTAALVSTFGFLIWVTYVVLPHTTNGGFPTPTTMTELSVGLVKGWQDLLGTYLPATAESHFLVAPCFLAWFAGAAAAELAQRHSNMVAPVIPPIALFGVTLLVGGANVSPQPLLVGALAAAALFTMLLHANRRLAVDPIASDKHNVAPQPLTDLSVDRRIISGLPVITVAAALATMATALFSEPMAERRYDPSNAYQLETIPSEQVSPLTAMKKTLVADPPVDMFRFKLSQSGDAQYLQQVRTSTLDLFDEGSVWLASDRGKFSHIGGVFPAFDWISSNVDTVEVGQSFWLAEGMPGIWLPAGENATQIRWTDGRVDVQFDKRSDALISTGSASLADIAYDISSRVPNPTPEQLDSATLARSRALDGFVDLPAGLASDENMQNLIATLEDPSLSLHAQAERIAAYLRENHTYSEDIESGHSYGHISDFLFVSRAGYAEQFAGAFAILARSMGIPTRLAVGFTVVDSDGLYIDRVTSSEIHVWPEIHLNDIGWTAIEPTPERVSVDQPEQDNEAAAEARGGLPKSQSGPTELGPTQGVGFGDEPSEDTRPWLIVASLAVLTVMAFLGLLAAKAFRRTMRRRRATTPGELVLAAWAEVIDRLLELGVEVKASMTPQEVADVSSDELGGAASARLRAMVPHVIAAVYSPREPSDDGAAEMWAHSRAFRQEVLAPRSRWVEVKALFSPRPLTSPLS